MLVCCKESERPPRSKTADIKMNGKGINIQFILLLARAIASKRRKQERQTAALNMNISRTLMDGKGRWVNPHPNGE